MAGRGSRAAGWRHLGGTPGQPMLLVPMLEAASGAHRSRPPAPCAVLAALGNAKQWDRAMGVVRSMRRHSLGSGLEPNAYTYSGGWAAGMSGVLSGVPELGRKRELWSVEESCKKGVSAECREELCQRGPLEPLRLAGDTASSVPLLLPHWNSAAQDNGRAGQVAAGRAPVC